MTTGDDPLHQDIDIEKAFSESFEHYQAGRLTDAAGLCERILTVNPHHGGALLISGVVKAHEGRFEEAIVWFERVAALCPDSAVAFFHMGCALHRLGRLNEAAARFEQTLRLEPGHAAARNNLAAVLRDRENGRPEGAASPDSELFAQALDHHQNNRLAEAEKAYRLTLEINPGNTAALNNLGLIVPPREAEILFKKALEYYPNHVDALFNMSNLLVSLGQHDQAVEWFQRTLAVDPEHQSALWNLISLLEGDSRLAEAQAYRRRIHRPKPVIVEDAPERRRSVLVLWCASTGVVPYYTLVPQQVNTRIRWVVDYATVDQEAALPPYDVVFNAVGDAEMMGHSLEFMKGFLGRSRRPLINQPERVALTRRDLMPSLLAGIPNVVAPPVVRLRRDEIDGHLIGRLAARGVTCPLLVRPIVGDRGKGMVLIETPAQLAEYSFPPGDAFYFKAYHDYHSADGCFRKYRTVFVDRKPYHYHLAISSKWLVHYMSADMVSEEWKREEERRFLEDPVGSLGAPAMAAVEAIGRRMDMEYAGIDYSVLPDGRVLVFEANATMSVYPSGDPMYAYKQKHINAVYEAFEVMLQRLAASPDAPAPCPSSPCPPSP